MSPADPDTPQNPALAELAKLTLGLARNLQVRALNAETAEDAARLATAFNGVARGLRQTLALDAKLARDGVADRAAAQAEADTRAAALEAERLKAIETRHHEIAAAVKKLIWDEYEKSEDADFLELELYAHLDAVRFDDDFLEGSLEEAVAYFYGELPILPDRTIDPEVRAEVDRLAREAEAHFAEKLAARRDTS